MRIYYDIELDGSYDSFSPKTKGMLEQIKLLVIQRLKVLESEINAERGEIIMQIMADTPGIEYNGFTRPLLDKLLTCVTNDDFKYLFGQLGI